MPKGIVHIDGEFCELPGKVVISHPEITEKLPTTFRIRNEAWVGSFIDYLREDDWDIAEITDQECFDMASNFVTVDKDLVFHYTGNPRVMKEVNERGIEVVQIPGEEMRKGLGGHPLHDLSHKKSLVFLVTIDETKVLKVEFFPSFHLSDSFLTHSLLSCLDAHSPLFDLFQVCYL